MIAAPYARKSTEQNGIADEARPLRRCSHETVPVLR